MSTSRQVPPWRQGFGTHLDWSVRKQIDELNCRFLMLWVILEARMKTAIAWGSFGKLSDSDMVTDLIAEHYKLIELAIIGLSCWEHCHVCPSFFCCRLYACACKLYYVWVQRQKTKASLQEVQSCISINVRLHLRERGWNPRSYSLQERQLKAHSDNAKKILTFASLSEKSSRATASISDIGIDTCAIVEARTGEARIWN